MESASLDLLNQLGRFPACFATDSAIKSGGAHPMFGELPIEDVRREERYLRHRYFTVGVALVLTWFVQAARYFPRLGAATFYVLITFGVCCFFLYPIWTKFLNRRPGALIAIGSALCLFWSIAELVLGEHLP
jgi:hypothetical protein